LGKNSVLGEEGEQGSHGPRASGRTGRWVEDGLPFSSMECRDNPISMEYGLDTQLQQGC
jgi:hypothetical protein